MKKQDMELKLQDWASKRKAYSALNQMDDSKVIDAAANSIMQMINEVFNEKSE
jgi:hypothetical protein